MQKWDCLQHLAWHLDSAHWGFYLGTTLKVLHPIKERFKLFHGSIWVCFLKRESWSEGNKSVPSKSAHNLKNKTSNSAKFSLLAEIKTYPHLIISPVLEELLTVKKKKKKKSPNYPNSEACKAAKENCIFPITTTCAALHTPFHKGLNNGTLPLPGVPPHIIPLAWWHSRAENHKPVVFLARGSHPHSLTVSFSAGSCALNLRFYSHVGYMCCVYTQWRDFIFHLSDLAVVLSGYMQTNKMIYHPKEHFKKCSSTSLSGRTF